MTNDIEIPFKPKYHLIEKLLFPYKKRTKIPRLDAKTILITGASYGIGLSVALTLAQKNAHFILVARTEAALYELRDQLIQKGASVRIITCDLRDKNQRNDLIETLSKYNQIDIFIHNAGHSINRNIMASKDRYHDADRLMQLHYHAPVDIILSCLDIIIQSKTHIINVSALNTLLPPAHGWAAYQASKVAFDQWLQSAAIELRPKGIAISTLYLPLVKTRMVNEEIYNARYPKMSPSHVSQIICDLISQKKRMFIPWWGRLITWTRVINRNWIEKIMINLSK